MVSEQDEIVRGHILVIFRDGVTLKWAEKIIKEKGYSVVSDYCDGFYPPLCVAVPEGKEDEAIKTFQSLPEVERACLDRNTPFPPRKKHK